LSLTPGPPSVVSPSARNTTPAASRVLFPERHCQATSRIVFTTVWFAAIYGVDEMLDVKQPGRQARTATENATVITIRERMHPSRYARSEMSLLATKFNGNAVEGFF
ncbi:MAG TPA: hypothetical protein VF920_02470, partial [Dongiaceae bacterium]